MKRQLSKREKIKERDRIYNLKKTLKAPKNGLENQSNIERLRKPKYYLGKDAHKENKRYKKWKSVSDIKRSFWVWRGRFSFSPKESEIVGILKEQNLRYYREVSFDMKKRFDFYIPLIDLVIEYDGKQHFNDLNEIKNDIDKEKILSKLGIKYIRYNKTHDLKSQIIYDLVNHPVLMK